MKKTGKIYGIFPVIIDDNEVEMKDCFINDYFMWLFIILMEMEGLAASCVGVDHMFMIKVDKKFRKK
jgi:hypothetical protein